MEAGAQIEGRFSFAADVLDVDADEMVVRDMKVFRVGTFTDMFGRTRDWTADDLDLAVENFRLLRDRNIVPNVPVKADHSMSVKDIGGYFLDVRREGKYLVADVEFTDEAMYEKYRKKTFRNRSLEIGQYVTNDGEAYNPVVLGLAFVDLPAVEGLYHLSTGDTMTTNTDPNPTTEESTTEEPTTEATATEEPTTEETEEQPPAAEATEQPAEPPAQETAPEPELVGAHGRPFAFRVNGAAVHDYAAVQAHIDTLETSLNEAVTSSRVEFIDKLAHNRAITGPQAEQFRKLVPEMNADQFAMFKAGFEVGTDGGETPPNLFGRHDLGDGGGDGAPTDARAHRVTVLRETVANHKRLGKSEEQIQQLQSWKELQALEAQV
jgi:hypothetical protein